MASTKKKKKFFWVKFWLVVIPGFFLVNWCYHAVNKPAEIFGLFDSHFYKNPAATWEAHGSLFEDHATAIMTPEFLAALAQAETQGNSVARTYWRWKLSSNPFEIYRPASSATGLFQITDGTFEKTKKLCVHNGEVAMDGPWHELDTCWFNFAYSRLITSHAIEMTSAYLHWTVTRLLEKTGAKNASLEQKQNLAALIHLCGPGRGDTFIKRGFKSAAGELCGSHSPRAYLNKVQSLLRIFSRLKGQEPRPTAQYAEI